MSNVNTLVVGIDMSGENYDNQKQFIFHKAENSRKVSILSNQCWDSETGLVLKVRQWLISEGMNPPACLGIRVLEEKGWCQLWFDREDYRSIGYKWFSMLRDRTDFILISSQGHPAWYLSFMMKKEVRRQVTLQEDDEMAGIFSGKSKPKETKVVRNISRRENIRQQDVEVDLDELGDDNPF